MEKLGFFGRDIFKEHRGIWYLSLLYFVFISAYVALKYYSFSYFDFDLAEQAQSVSGILKGSLYSSILETNFLGNHGRFIFFLIAPFYFVFNSPLFLLLLQNIAVVLGGVVIYFIAIDYVKKIFALLVSLVFLLHPATVCALIYEFHSEVLAVFFLSVMLLSFLKERYKLFLTAVVFACLCKENIPLLIVMMSILAFFKKRSFKWYFVPFVFSLGYFLTYVMYLQPKFNNGAVVLNNMYSHLGESLPEMIINFVKNPFYAFSYTVGFKDFMLFLQLLGPFAFLVFKPSYIVILLPLVLQHLLSLRPSDHSIVYHYYAVFVPFLSLSFIFCLRDILNVFKNEKFQKAFAVTLFVGCVLLSIVLNPTASFFKVPFAKIKNPAVNVKHNFLKVIPDNAVVCASMEFLPFLLDKKKVHSFHYVTSGTYTLSFDDYKQPKDVDFLLYDTNNIILQKSFIKEDTSKNVQEFVQTNELYPVSFYESTILFAKDSTQIMPPFELLEKPLLKTNKDVSFEDKLKLINSLVKYNEKTDVLDIELVFKVLKKPEQNYWIMFKTLDSKLKLYDNTYMPLTFLLHPTSAWEAGEVYKVRHRILIDTELEKGAYYIGFLLFDKKSKKIISSDKSLNKPNAIAKITKA